MYLKLIKSFRFILGHNINNNNKKKSNKQKEKERIKKRDDRYIIIIDRRNNKKNILYFYAPYINNGNIKIRHRKIINSPNNDNNKKVEISK